MRRRPWVAGVALGLPAAALAALAVWSVFVEPGRLVVTPVLVRSARWPRGRAPLRIAVVTDLHVGSLRNGLDRLDDVVARTNEQHADVVVLLGDFIHGKRRLGFVPP